MQVNKYAFADCKFEISSDSPIVAEGYYGSFAADFTTPDYSIRVKRVSELPEKQGNCVYEYDKGSLYIGDATRKFKAFIDMKTRANADFACLENETDLYVKHSGEITEFVVFESLDLPDLLLKKGIAILHCSYIEVDGEAILFAGDKQVGKSTQAALWQNYKGAQVRNGDRAGVFVRDGRVYACGVPYCGTSGICHNVVLPVRAIVGLSRGTENVISGISILESVLFLLNKIAYNYWDRAASDTAFSIIENICKSVDFITYSCRKDESAVDCLYDFLKKGN